jgi:hypothetical protein
MMSAQMAPNFTLQHIAGRNVSLSEFQGRATVLIFSGRDSIEQAQRIGQTIRSRYDVYALPIVSILDLSGVPRMMQGLAKGRVQSGYEEMVKMATAALQAQGKPMPPDPSQVIMMCPDWDGNVTKSFGLQAVDQQAVAVLVDGQGYIRGYGAGMQGGDQILALFGQ